MTDDGVTRADGYDDDRSVVSAYLDGELDAAAASAFDAARANDATIAAEMDAVAEVRALVRGLPVLELPAPDRAVVLAAVSATAAEADDAALAASPTAATVPDNVVPFSRRRSLRRRATAALAGSAAAAAVLVAVVIPVTGPTRPALASDVRVHQAGAAASGDPVSGLAPVATALRVGR